MSELSRGSHGTSDAHGTEYEATLEGDDIDTYDAAGLDAMLTEEEQLPEPRTRQEARTDTWDDTTDDSDDSDLSTEYDGDLDALLTEEQSLPESRTRQEARTETWGDASSDGNDQAAASPGVVGGYDGDLDALLAEGQRLPEPRTRQEVRVDTGGSTNGSSQDAETSPDVGDSGDRPANRSAQDAYTGNNNGEAESHLEEQESAQTVYVDGEKIEVTDRADDGIWVEGLPGKPPDKVGDILLSKGEDKSTRADRLFNRAVEKSDDLLDSIEKNVNLGAQALRPPVHAEVPVRAAPYTPDVHHHEPEAGNLATAGLALGIILWGAGRAIHKKLEERDNVRN